MTSLPPCSPDPSAPAIVTSTTTICWRDLWSLAADGLASRQRRARRAGPDISSVVELCRGLVHGDVVVLGHPRWPLCWQRDAFAGAGAGRALPPSWQVDDALGGTIVFSSGSTARPKAILHHTRAHLENARGANAVMPFEPGDRWLLSLPTCHVGGLAILFRAIVGGGAVAIANSAMELADAIVALQPTHLSLVAVQLRRLLAAPAALAALRSAKLVLVGGGPTPAAILEAGREAGLPLRQTWGLSEMGSQVCTSAHRHPESCGFALPGRHLRVADDGQLWVGGAPRFAGFVEVDALHAERERPALFDAQGNYASGDLGVLRDDGLVIVGRRDSQFVSGGENVHPEAIEAALGDATATVTVVAVDDARFDKRPFAFFDGDGDDDALRKRLQQRAEALLPRFMQPAAFHRLPTAGGQKPARRDLEQLAARITATTTAQRSTISQENTMVSELFDASAWDEVSELSFTDITYHRAREQGTVRIAFDRPDCRNAFRPHTVDELIEALDHARTSSDVGCVLITGNGPSPKDGGWAFCSGGDQRVRGKDGYLFDGDGDRHDSDAERNPADQARLGRLHILEAQRLIRFMPKIVIAVVPGWAVGGGHSLHVVCDLTLASREHGRFKQTDADVASFDGGYGSALLARQVGQKRAREIFFLGLDYTAEEAFQLGMVNAVVDHAELERKALEWGALINDKSPTAMRMLKYAFNLPDDGMVGQQLFAGEATRLAYGTAEAQEGRDAFLEKRPKAFRRFPWHF